MTQSPQPTPSAAPRNAVAMADPLVLFRWLDVVLVVLAAPFIVLMGLPVLGYAVGTVVAGLALSVAGLAVADRWHRRRGGAGEDA